MTHPDEAQHEFTEDRDDYSMCLCGISAVDHDIAYPAAGEPRKDER